jgi:hypothetical protein
VLQQAQIAELYATGHRREGEALLAKFMDSLMDALACLIDNPKSDHDGERLKLTKNCCVNL